MLDLERRCRISFVESRLPILFLDYHGPTGNIAILAKAIPADDIRNALFRAIPKPCALVKPEVVEQANQVFFSWPAPADIAGFQWTPGVSLLCTGQPDADELTAPDLGVFKRMSSTVLLLYRKERVTGRGTLHSDRKGGWAAVSHRADTRLGGSWTARSSSVLQKVLSRGHRKLASGDAGNTGLS